MDSYEGSTSYAKTSEINEYLMGSYDLFRYVLNDKTKLEILRLIHQMPSEVKKNILRKIDQNLENGLNLADYLICETCQELEKCAGYSYMLCAKCQENEIYKDHLYEFSLQDENYKIKILYLLRDLPIEIKNNILIKVNIELRKEIMDLEKAEEMYFLTHERYDHYDSDWYWSE